MAESKHFLLPAPWAHFDPKHRDLGIGRRELAEGTTTEVVAGVPLFLAAPPNSKIEISGHKMGVEPLGSAYQLGGQSYQLYLISTGTRSNEDEVEVEIGKFPVGRIRIEGFFPRPAFSGREENKSTPTILAEEIDLFILTLIDIIKQAGDSQYGDIQIFWKRMSAAWFSERFQTKDPPVAVIVRHADTLQLLIRDLAERPRKILQRTRELTAASRVEQLDTTCVRWLSRQPGEDVWEQAGPLQRILAVRRFESFATLENRVLRDYAFRAQVSGSAYTRRYSELSERSRWKSVASYRRGCRRVEQFLKENNVAKVHPPVTPNYVLLQDVRYRRLWKAYLEIVRQQDEEDEAWRWQYRLWMDAVRIMVHLGIGASDRFGRIAENPIRIRDEQDRGIWTEIDDLSGVWLIDLPNVGEVIVSLMWAISDAQVPMLKHFQGLGCTALLHLQVVAGEAEAFIPVWAVHHFTGETPTLTETIASANRAIQSFVHNSLLAEGIELLVAGLVVISDIQTDLRRTEKQVAHEELVIGFQYRITPSQRESLMSKIPEGVLQLAKLLLSGSKQDL